MTHATQQTTIEDYSARLEFHLGEATKALQKAAQKIASEWNAQGMTGSSRYPLFLYESVEQAYRSGIDVALGECSRASRITTLSIAQLRPVTEEKLNGFLSAAKKALDRPSMSPSQKQTIAPLLPKLDAYLKFALRQFDVGLLTRPEPSVPPSMSNSISIGVMSGGLLQQGTVGSTQTVSNAFNAQELGAATEALLTALRNEPTPPAQLTVIEADIATIRAQLAKPTPSSTILREAGQSIRHITEGIVAGALTPSTIAAAQTLFAMMCLR